MSKRKSNADLTDLGSYKAPKTTLEEAYEICTSERNVSYGSPLDNHTVTADLYNAYLAGRNAAGKPWLDAEAVCMLAILAKISRTCHGETSRDTIVDIEGYAFNLEQIGYAREERVL